MTPLAVVLILGFAALAYFFVLRPPRDKPKELPPKRASHPPPQPPPQPEADLNKRVRPPRRRGPPEEIKADEGRYLGEMNRMNEALFLRTRAQAMRAGSKKYIWRTCADGDVCPACARNNGKRFSWDAPPGNPFPGRGGTCSVGYCRCFPEAILPDL